MRKGRVAYLPVIYQKADIEKKRKLISSMFPENLTSDGVQHRTNRLNEAIRVFNSVKPIFETKKKDKSAKIADLSSMVESSGKSSNFFNDVEAIVNARRLIENMGNL